MDIYIKLNFITERQTEIALYMTITNNIILRKFLIKLV